MNRTPILIATMTLILAFVITPTASATCPADGGVVGGARCAADDTIAQGMSIAGGAVTTGLKAVDDTHTLLCGPSGSGCDVSGDIDPWVQTAERTKAQVENAARQIWYIVENELP